MKEAETWTINFKNALRMTKKRFNEEIIGEMKNESCRNSGRDEGECGRTKRTKKHI